MLLDGTTHHLQASSCGGFLTRLVPRPRAARCSDDGMWPGPHLRGLQTGRYRQWCCTKTASVGFHLLLCERAAFPYSPLFFKV